MPTPILSTKLYIPPVQPNVVSRPRLIDRLNEGLRQYQGFGRKLTLISAPAGFGKTTLLSEWVSGGGRRAAWLSLDEGDSEPTRFLMYVIAALQTLASRQAAFANVGKGVLNALQSPQPPSIEVLLTTLLNDITAIPDSVLFVFDDYHMLADRPVDTLMSVDDMLSFLLDHLPPRMHIVIATREDPALPLARLRARGQLTELRAADLRFPLTEAAEFLNQAMKLNLAPDDIAALDTRTEGWIAGLQLAALALQGPLSMQGQEDAASFIAAFTGSHRFVLDYLVEEVLHRQPEHIQSFLLRTSILDRLCGPLCEAVLEESAGCGQTALEYLEHANLFLIPLDHERRWYRYHHLFGGFLRQRLQHNMSSAAGAEQERAAVLHIRASQWYEEHGLELEAFRHAAAAHDFDRAVRLIESQGMPIHFRSTAAIILDWLASLPKSVKDARPALWVKSATVSLVAGQTTGVEEKLQAAETALQAAGLVPPVPGEFEGRAVERLDNTTRDLVGHTHDLVGHTHDLVGHTHDLVGQIAAARATLALTRYQADIILVQARRALMYLPPENLTFRFTAMWTLGVAYHLMGDRVAAIRAYTEAVALSQASGDDFSTTLAISGLGELQELDNQLSAAAENYRYVLQLYGDQPQPNAGEAHLGLARICYEWNDLEAAEQHGQQSLQLTRQYDRTIDRFILSEVFLTRLKLARGDVTSAAEMIVQAEQTVRQKNFVHRLPEVAAVQALVLLRQGKLAEAERVAQIHNLPLSQARVLLAQGNPSAALAILEPLRQQMETQGWHDERLKIMILQALAFQAQGETEQALTVLKEALSLTEPEGFIRLFVDEGEPMRLLIADCRSQIVKSSHSQDVHLSRYIGKLLAAFPGSTAMRRSTIHNPQSHMLPDPLSERELEVLRLVAQGLSNQAIGERLFLALDTIKGHNRKIFGKLHVKSRTEAVARARELGLL